MNETKESVDRQVSIIVQLPLPEEEKATPARTKDELLAKQAEQIDTPVTLAPPATQLRRALKIIRENPRMRIGDLATMHGIGTAALYKAQKLSGQKSHTRERRPKPEHVIERCVAVVTLARDYPQMRVREIGIRLGLTASAVYYILLKAGVARTFDAGRPAKAVTARPAQTARNLKSNQAPIVNMYVDNLTLSLAQIGSVFNISRQRVHQIVSRAGVRRIRQILCERSSSARELCCVDNHEIPLTAP